METLKAKLERGAKIRWKEKDDGDLFINKLVDLLNWFAQQVRRERLKLHRQLSSVLQVGRSLFFEIFFI